MLKKAFLTNSSGIMCSRIFGFLRDLSMAHILGAGIYSDIFFVAFKFPNLFRRIFCEGAFSQSFLPNFIASSKKGAFVVLTLGAFSIILLCLSLFVMAFSGGVTRILALGFSQNLIEIAKPIVAIHFWYLLLVFWVTFFSALLQYKQHFWVSAYNTALLNIAMILALFLAQGKDELEIVYFVSYGVLLGGVAQVGLHFYPLWKLGFWRLFVCGVLEIKKAFFSGGNSPAGSHLANPSTPLHCGARPSAPHSQGETICQSTTSRARIVDSSISESSLRENPQDSRGNLTQNDKTNSPSLAEGVRGRVDSNAELSLQDSESERGKTRQSRSFFSNLNGIASDFKNAQLKIQGDCHAQQVALAMTEKRDCHESAYADSHNDEKTREFNSDFDKSISNDNVACRPEGVGKNARSILKTQNRDFSLIAQNDNDRDISGLSPQYGKDIECYDIDCVKSSMHNGTNEISTMPKSLHFTLKARANTNALLANAKAQITGIIQSLLENQTSISPNIRISNQYSAWANQNDSISNATSPILQIIIDAYKWRHCEVGSIHAGLECGILQERFKQMGLGEIAMASIGPSIFSPHSLQERLDLGSFEEFIEVLKCALDNICTQNI